jgi:hypothetical protein
MLSSLRYFEKYGSSYHLGLAAIPTARPQPEAEQVVSRSVKRFYMDAAAVAPRPPAQQKVILQMAEKASNGKELLLVMRAAVGGFRADAGSQEHPVERQVRSIVMAKMMECGTLDQLIEYATQYTVNPASARPFVQQIFRFGEGNSDPRVWYRIRISASHVNVGDLEQEAQARGDKLAGR